MMNAASLTDDALTVELARLAGREREATAALIVHLAEFDARRLYEGAGYPSMFAYCRAVLRLSEDAAYNRIKAARATHLYPAIVAMLADGALNPTSVRLLAPHLTEENHAVLLAEAAGMGKEDVLRRLARWFPQPDVAASVRKVPSQVASTSSADCEIVAAPPAPLALLGLTPASPCSPVLIPPKPPLIRPLAPERYEVRFTADAETRALLKEAQDLLGHAVRRATSPPSSTARWPFSSRTSSGGSSGRRRGRDRRELRTGRPAIFRPPCVVRSPRVTRNVARSSPRMCTAAKRHDSWNSTMSCHGRRR
jgi:hypothetical protein